MSLEYQIGPNEHILWFGTKNKKVSVFEAIFNPMLPFALLWGLVDFTFIAMASSATKYDSSDTGRSMIGFFISFFALHLMPVWLYLGGVLTSALRAKNTNYVVTDQAVYIETGVLNTTTERIAYQQVISAGTAQSFFDKRALTGDVVLKLDEIMYSGKRRTPHQRQIKIENIPDYIELYQTIMQYQPLFATGVSDYPPQDMRSYMQQQMQQYGNPPQNPQYGNPQYGNPQYGSPPQEPQYGDQYGDRSDDRRW